MFLVIQFGDICDYNDFVACGKADIRFCASDDFNPIIVGGRGGGIFAPTIAYFSICVYTGADFL